VVGTIAGAGHFAASLLAAAFVVGTNLLLRPLVRRINRLSVTTADAETFYTVQIVGPAQPRAAGFRHELAGRSQRGHRRGDAGTGASDAPRAGVPLARSRGYQT